MTKRSPILGYNHNVRYRGLVFHVQTEDSGLRAPHLFTHLFHSGVIVSTRKYVYDAGSTEEAIKSLMQAQHKAVMKELKRGGFDDKIDVYLAGTPGLLPRGVRDAADAEAGGEPDRAASSLDSAPVAVPATASAPVTAPVAIPEMASAPVTAPVVAPPSAPVAAPPVAAAPVAAPPVAAPPVAAPPVAAPPVAARPAAARPPAPPPTPARRVTPNPMPALARASSPVMRAIDPDDLEEATIIGGEPAISRENTLEETPIGLRPTEQAVEAPLMGRVMTAEKTSAPSQVKTSLPASGPGVRKPPFPLNQAQSMVGEDAADTLRSADPLGDSQPEISLEVELEADDPESKPRLPALRKRPAEVVDTGSFETTRVDVAPVSDGVPGALPASATLRASLDTGPVATGASGPITGPLSQRTKAVGAASLPPARPIPRPASRPAIVPPQVVSRPVSADDRRTPPPDAVEVYAAPPPSAELPGEPPERPGQYSQHKKISSRIPLDDEGRSAPAPGVISQLTRPGSSPAIPAPVRQVSTSQVTLPRTSPSPVPGSIPVISRTATPPAGRPPMPGPIPVPARAATPQPGAPQAAASSTTTQPARGGVPAPVGHQPSRPVAVITAPGRPTPIPVPVVRPPAEPAKPRTLTPQRVSTTAPAAGPPPPPPAALSSGRVGAPSRDSSVVMTRPAVIVGAPKPTASTSRVRKAREEESRSFGQGLISEKSLDEVILAYLSEDAEDK